MEIVFVELADKTGEVAVLEMFGKDGLGELFVLFSGRLGSAKNARPCRVGERKRALGRTSSTTKLSPSFPQRTTDAYWGSSSILLSIGHVSQYIYCVRS